MVYLIVMASGASKRFGENKLLYSFNGKKLYRYLIDELVTLTKYQIIVVTSYEEIKKEVEDRMVVVLNCESEKGITSSIHLGIQTARQIEDSVDNIYVFFTADQPFLNAQLIEDFIEQFKQSPYGLGCLASGKNLGNPGIFRQKYVEELLKLQGDKGGKSIIKQNKEDGFFYPVQKEVLIDIDTKEILRQLEEE